MKEKQITYAINYNTKEIKNAIYSIGKRWKHDLFMKPPSNLAVRFSHDTDAVL